MIEQLRVKPGGKARIASRDARDTLGIDDKAAGKARLEEVVERLAALQPAALRRARTGSLLLVLQWIDASGKDGTIRHVLTGVNPEGLLRRRLRAAARA